METDTEDGGTRRSLSCGDMYSLLEDEKQILLKQASLGEANVLAPPMAATAPTAAGDNRHASGLDASATRSQLSISKAVDGGWGWMIVLGAFFVHLIIDGLCCSFGVFLMELDEFFEASLAKLSLSGALICALPMILAPVSAGLVDAWGYRTVGFAGGFISAVGAAGGAFAPSLDSLIAVFGLLVGFGMSMTLTTSFVVVAVYFERRRAVAAALTISGIGLGSCLWPPLVQFLIEAYSWRGALLVISALLLQSGAFCLLFRPLEEGPQLRRRLYLRTLENFSRIAGYGEFLMGKEYLTSSLVQQIAMLRAHVSIGSPACSAAHGIGNSTVETLAWPSGIEDSTTSSSSSSQASAASSSSSSSLPGKGPPSSGQGGARLAVVQEAMVLQESCHLLEASAPSLHAPPSVPITFDGGAASGTDGDDTLCHLDELADNLRDIDICDTMPDPESYRILLPDPTLDVIPENAELDLTALSLSRMAGSCLSSGASSASSENVQILHSQAYDTYLDLSNPQLDDEDEDGLPGGGLLSYKSLASERSNSGRLASLASSAMSQSLGSLSLKASSRVRVALSASGILGSGAGLAGIDDGCGGGCGVEVGGDGDLEAPLLRSSSDPELLRRRRAPRPADLFSPAPKAPPMPPSPSPPRTPSPPAAPPLPIIETLVPLAAAEDDDVDDESSSLSPSSPRREEVSPSCWDPLLLPPSPDHRPKSITKLSAASVPEECAVGGRHAAFEEAAVMAVVTSGGSGRGEEPRLRPNGDCVPFSSIGRLNLALSLPLLGGLSEQELSCVSADDSGEQSSARQQQGEESGRRLFLRSLFCCNEVCTEPAFLCLFLSNFLVFCFYNVSTFYLGLYCGDVGATARQAALQFSVMGAANFVGQVLVGLLGNLACMDNVIFFSIMQSLLGASIFILPLLTNFHTLFIHTISFGLALSANDALSSVMSVHLLGPEKANAGISINLFGQGLANLVGPPLLGAILDSSSSFAPAFFLSGGAIMLAGLVMLPAIVLDRRRRRGPRKSASRARPAQSEVRTEVELV